MQHFACATILCVFKPTYPTGLVFQKCCKYCLHAVVVCTFCVLSSLCATLPLFCKTLACHNILCSSLFQLMLIGFTFPLCSKPRAVKMLSFAVVLFQYLIEVMLKSTHHILAGDDWSVLSLQVQTPISGAKSFSPVGWQRACVPQMELGIPF